MKTLQCTLATCCLLAFTGCGSATQSASMNSPTETTLVSERVVEATCGECQLGMDGTGCDLAVRIDDQAYFVDGTSMDEHGDAHGADGMCNCIRQAKVSGEIINGRFTADSFELLPLDSPIEKDATDNLKSE